MIGLVVLVFHVLGFVSSLHAVMTNRTAQGTIAWGLSLNLIPYASVPLYWVFGQRRFQGYVESWRDRQREADELVAQIHEKLDPFELETLQEIPNYQALVKIARSPILRGNDVRLLVDGEATFDSVIDGLSRAESYALVEFYIVRDDGLGRRLKAAMIDAAERGVDVYFLYDEIGSKDLPRSYLADLEASGVRSSRFNSTQGWRNRFQLNFRNHRKCVVIDGRESWIGGHNVGDEYLGLDPDVGPWRDTHVHVRGPVVQLAQLVFLADWYWATRTRPDLDWEPREAPGDADVKAVVVPISPVRDLEQGELFFVHALNGARERIWIASPYFVPDPSVMTALRLAALRGVDVRVIVPGNPDKLVVGLAADWFMEQLDGLGIRFYKYQPGFMHQKVVLVDGDVSTVGSTNFDNRSFRLQFEMNVVFVDEPFASEIEDMLMQDFERSAPYDPASLREAPYWRRLASAVARLTAPIL